MTTPQQGISDYISAVLGIVISISFLEKIGYPANLILALAGILALVHKIALLGYEATLKKMKQGPRHRFVLVIGTALLFVSAGLGLVLILAPYPTLHEILTSPILVGFSSGSLMAQLLATLSMLEIRVYLRGFRITLPPEPVYVPRSGEEIVVRIENGLQEDLRVSAKLVFPDKVDVYSEPLYREEEVELEAELKRVAPSPARIESPFEKKFSLSRKRSDDIALWIYPSTKAPKTAGERETIEIEIDNGLQTYAANLDIRL